MSEHPDQQFGDVLWSCRKQVFGYLARRCPQDADDLLVDVWVTAYQSRGSFDPSLGEMRGWLFGVARNVLRAHLRVQQRNRVGFARQTADLELDDWSSVDARLDAEAKSDQLREALAGLPPEEREVLLLVAWEDLSPSEAAAALGIPPGTARSRLFRARRRLDPSFRERSDDGQASK